MVNRDRGPEKITSYREKQNVFKNPSMYINTIRKGY
jgi:hypothetical protein